MVGVHIRGDNRDKCSACVIATRNFFQKYIDVTDQNFHGNNYDNGEHKKKKLPFVVATYSKRDIRGVMTNSTNIVLTEKEDPFVDMAILEGFHHLIIATITYGWWSAWLGAHQR